MDAENDLSVWFAGGVVLSHLSQEPQLIVQTGHATGVIEVEFSSDGKLLATLG
jgi:hypothetical protein